MITKNYFFAIMAKNSWRLIVITEIDLFLLVSQLRFQRQPEVASGVLHSQVAFNPLRAVNQI